MDPVWVKDRKGEEERERWKRRRRRRDRGVGEEIFECSHAAALSNRKKWEGSSTAAASWPNTKELLSTGSENRGRSKNWTLFNVINGKWSSFRDEEKERRLMTAAKKMSWRWKKTDLLLLALATVALLPTAADSKTAFKVWRWLGLQFSDAAWPT
jgi:hypothetical protein